MNRLAVLVVAAAVLVWVGQWISLRAASAAPSLPRRLHGRVLWWAGHRAAVGVACATVAVGGLAGGLLAG